MAPTVGHEAACADLLAEEGPYLGAQLRGSGGMSTGSNLKSFMLIGFQRVSCQAWSMPL